MDHGSCSLISIKTTFLETIFHSLPTFISNVSPCDKCSREIFNKEQAQGWWAENCDKITELCNVRAHAKDKPAAVPTPPRSEDEVT
jgi:hypothetical protein